MRGGCVGKGADTETYLTEFLRDVVGDLRGQVELLQAGGPEEVQLLGAAGLRARVVALERQNETLARENDELAAQLEASTEGLEMMEARCTAAEQRAARAEQQLLGAPPSLDDVCSLQFAVRLTSSLCCRSGSWRCGHASRRRPGALHRRLDQRPAGHTPLPAQRPAAARPQPSRGRPRSGDDQQRRSLVGWLAQLRRGAAGGLAPPGERSAPHAMTPQRLVSPTAASVFPCRC